jgi:hypothetical protein
MLKRIFVLMLACTLGSLAFLAVGCLQAGYWLALPGLVVLGVGWLLVPVPRLGWLPSLLFALLVLAAALIALLGVPAWFTLPAVILGLAAWDLAGYSRQERAGMQLSDGVGLRRRLLALGLTCLAGFLAAGATLVIRLQLPLGAALAAGLLAVTGLGLSYHWLRQGFDPDGSSED